ncbi:MAG: alpha/beta hydrolase [Planctomycetota bacterium]
MTSTPTGHIAPETGSPRTPTSVEPGAAGPRPVTLEGRHGATIHATLQQLGRGRDVVFLHGLVGLNEHWEDVVSRIRGRCLCHLLELPLLDLDPVDCSIEAVTDVTIAFLEATIARPVCLVGNSFGGHVALRIAIHRPDLCNALVLAGASGLMERTLVRGAPVRPSRNWLEEKIGELFYDKAHMRRDDVERAHAALRERGGARAMVRLSKTARRDNLEARLGDVRVPTLLIWGREDVVTPPSAAELFMDKLPDARIRWLDRCGHAPMLESPDAFADALLDFVDDLDRRARDASA